jgi:hypothetical protein
MERDAMRKLLLGVTLALLIAFMTSPVSAFPRSPGYPLAQSTTNNTDLIQIKGGYGWGHGGGWGNGYGYRPLGWSRGRKVGWRGYGCPPGLWKQGRC